MVRRVFENDKEWFRSYMESTGRIDLELFRKVSEGDVPKGHHVLHQGHHIRRRGESKVEAWRWREELRLLQW
jgi:hypothetical protein